MLSSDHLLSLVNDILDVSRIESGKMSFNEDIVSLPDAVIEVQDMFDEKAEAVGIDLTIDVDSLAHPQVVTDPLRLNQILVNTVGNAVKFTPAGGLVTVTLTELPDAPRGFGSYRMTVSDTGCGMTPEQVIGGWLLRPEVWQNEPMIYIKNEALRRLLHLETPYACLADLFDGEKYRLQKFWKGKQDHHQKMTSLEKAIVEADEKVGLILMLQNGTLIRPLPEDGSVEPVSDTKIQAELLYNRIPFSKLLFMFNLTVGMLAFFRLLYRGLRRSSALSDSSGRIVALSFSSRLADTFFPFSLYAAFLFQLFGYGLRWYIGGRIPLGNGYETMQFMALCALFLACLFRRRFPFMVPFGFLLSGFALLVSYLGQMNPQITPLMPVLVSPWLSTHVSLIMMSYALFAFMMLNGILALCLRRSARMLMLLSRLLLYPAVFFLGAGIFLGAVWANASWGRYWAWDPKEVWALITFMVYGAAFHARSLRIFRSPLFFHIYMIVAFLTVLMTYFGVNYILGGMHSYANA